MPSAAQVLLELGLGIDLELTESTVKGGAGSLPTSPAACSSPGLVSSSTAGYWAAPAPPGSSLLAFHHPPVSGSCVVSLKLGGRVHSHLTRRAIEAPLFARAVPASHGDSCRILLRPRLWGAGRTGGGRGRGGSVQEVWLGGLPGSRFWSQWRLQWGTSRGRSRSFALRLFRGLASGNRSWGARHPILGQVWPFLLVLGSFCGFEFSGMFVAFIMSFCLVRRVEPQVTDVARDE